MKWVIIFIIFGVVNLALMFVPPADFVTFLNAFCGASCLLTARSEWHGYKSYKGKQ